MSRRIAPSEAFEVCDVVETDFSGHVTRHIVIERFKTRNCESGVTYQLLPPVPKSGGRESRVDHHWFKRIGCIRFDGAEKIVFVPQVSQ